MLDHGWNVGLGPIWQDRTVGQGDKGSIRLSGAMPVRAREGM